MWWCWGKGTSVICWRITRPTTTGCARTLRSTRMLRSIHLRRQSGLSHQSLGSAVSIGTTFEWHNRYTQATLGEHTEAVLTEIGYTPAEIERLAKGPAPEE